MKEKTYCWNCKHFDANTIGFDKRKEICFSNPTYYDTYYNNKAKYEEPKIKNKDNSCKEWESKK